MPKNETILRLLRWEEERELWKKEVLGFPPWGLERLRVYRGELAREQRRAGGGTTQPQGSARLAAEGRALRASLASIAGFDHKSLPQRDLWVLSTTNCRKEDEQGQGRCIFTGPLEAQLGDRLLFLEFDTARRGGLLPSDTVILDAIQAPILAASRLLAPLVERGLRATGRGIESDFAPVSPRRIVDRSIYGRTLYELAKRWISRAPPKAAFVLGGYGMHQPIQIALKEAGIPVIELQHGLLHESHVGYIVPTVSAELERRTPWPNHLVLFGPFWGRMLEVECERWRGRWSVGGHPWLLGKRSTMNAAPTESERPAVVFFSQYEEIVRKQVLAAANVLRKELPESHRILIKPHPREYDAERGYAGRSPGIELAGPGEDSYSLLARCSVAVSVYSTLALEALAFPCRSLVLRSPFWTDTIHDFVARGLLEAANDGEDAARILKTNPEFKDRGGVAQDLFGLGVPALDWMALITSVRTESTETDSPLRT